MNIIVFLFSISVIGILFWFYKSNQISQLKHNLNVISLENEIKYYKDITKGNKKESNCFTVYDKLDILSQQVQLLEIISNQTN
jgi:hypothetical protein